MISFFLSILIYTIYAEEVSRGGLREKLLENDEVKKAFDLCKRDDYCPHYDCSSRSEYNNFDDCIWKNLDASTQKNLSEVFAKKNLGPTSAPTGVQKPSDPAMAKLREYLSKRLQEALYGDIKKEGIKRKRVVNHVDFIHIYESQVSKNVILSISSYCFDAYSDGEYKYLIPTDEQEIKNNRKTNSSKLSELTLEKTSSSASIHWNRCIQVVQHICHKNTKKYNEISRNTFDLANNNHVQMTDNSTQRACAVNDSIKKARAKLIYLTVVKKIYKNTNKNSHNIADSYPEVYTGRGDQKSIDEITSISSNELINKSGFNNANKQMIEDFKNNCDPDVTKQDQRDAEACAKYISKNKEAHEKELDEYRIRSLATQKKIDDLKNKEEIKQYLKQEGYEDQKIEEMTNDNNLDLIKTQIQNRYTQERNQIIKNLTDRIKKRSVKEDEKASEAQGIADIFNELKERSDYFKQLIHYNNIVSGYLNIKNSENKEITKNTKSIEIELEGESSNKDEGDSPELKDEQAKIEESLKALKGDEDDEQNSTNSLGIDTINTVILNYDIVEDKP